MTIREYLRRRSDRHAVLSIAFLMLVGLSANFLPRLRPLRIAFAVIVAVLIIAAFLSLFEIPCPKCRQALRSLGLKVSLGAARAASAQCPHCGISMDAELPQTPRPGIPAP